jgi:NAD(P)-dependent dehydrogenase (short-subunit alcohol dehydrogenase family)
MKTVVVGASSGLGRCIGVAFARDGDEVALLARRVDHLEQAVAESGSTNAHAIRCDVTDASACRAAIDDAAERLGGIDALVYASASATLRKLADLDADDWAATFATNVTGASLVTAAALPHLTESRGAAAYLSSVSASMTAPWPGLASYVVSKAALEKLVEAWRAEHPEVGFTRLVVGDCPGGEGPYQTQFTAGWDVDLMGELGPQWLERGLIAGSLLDVEELIRVLRTVLGAGATACIPVAAVMPRPSGDNGLPEDPHRSRSG